MQKSSDNFYPKQFKGPKNSHFKAAQEKKVRPTTGVVHPSKDTDLFVPQAGRLK